MKNGNKAFPDQQIEIGGETITIRCDWKTIYNYEKIANQPITSLTSTNYLAVSVAIDFIFAAIGHKNPRKYTKDWVIENMNKELWMKVGSQLIPLAIQAALLDEETIAAEKKDEPASSDKAQDNPA